MSTRSLCRELCNCVPYSSTLACFYLSRMLRGLKYPSHVLLDLLKHAGNACSACVAVPGSCIWLRSMHAGQVLHLPYRSCKCVPSERVVECTGASKVGTGVWCWHVHLGTGPRTGWVHGRF